LYFYAVFGVESGFDISKSGEVIFQKVYRFPVEVFLVFFFGEEREFVSVSFVFDFFDGFFEAFIEFLEVEEFLFGVSGKDFVSDEVWIVEEILFYFCNLC
jgi:hypothetical protein